MRTFIRNLTIAGISLLLLRSLSFGYDFGYEIDSRYAALIYTDEKQLSEFGVKALPNISYQDMGSILHDEVTTKLDILISKVATILLNSQPPGQLKFAILLVPSTADIRTIYSAKYGKDKDYIAFYAPQDNTLFISASDARPGVLAHEIAHVIIYHYYYHSIPVYLHELLAQYVETHMDDY